MRCVSARQTPAYPSQNGSDGLLTAGHAPEQRAGCGAHLGAVLGLLQELLLHLVQLLSQSQLLLVSKQSQKDGQNSTSKYLVFSPDIFKGKKCAQNYRKQLANENHALESPNHI